MSISTIITRGLGGTGHRNGDVIRGGLASYTGLPEPPVVGTQYQACTSLYSGGGWSLEIGSVPPVAIGDVFIASLVTIPGAHLVQVNGDGTGEVSIGGDLSRQWFQYSIYRAATNTIDGPAPFWINEIAPTWATLVFLNNLTVGVPITPQNLASPTYASSFSGDVLAFAIASGALPPGITLSSAGILQGTPTASGTFNFTISATDYALVSTISPASQMIVAGTAVTVTTVATGIGSQSDIFNRLQRLMPSGWFAQGATPIRDALLVGIANSMAAVFSLFAYLKLQTRLATATDGFLDLFALDYFGGELPREAGQGDASYKARIQAELLPEKNTRQAIINALTLITGRVPIVFEPARPADTGAYNTGVLAYGAAGGYGSLQYPYQCFVVAYRPLGAGIPSIAGYGVSSGAYNTASQASYVNLSQIQGQITDADIYAAIESVRMGGTTIWARISS